MADRCSRSPGADHRFIPVAGFLLYLGAHATGLGAAAWHFETLRAWTVGGPFLAPIVRPPLLIAGAVATELIVIMICVDASRAAGARGRPTAEAPGQAE